MLPNIVLKIISKLLQTPWTTGRRIRLVLMRDININALCLRELLAHNAWDESREKGYRPRIEPVSQLSLELSNR